ncbi:retrotransposable element Tf2 [Tanacetum coccineum]|uniref:Retrotransposable element Tf2 n=1 Tax=Tanacetum coccineum TaxID=301880 RepID=A0ABQ4X1K7_9ASTR
MSTAYHPQTDGQIEVVNKCLECYLRCMSGERPKKWVQWLSLAEYWYNTNKHSSINVSPNEAIYGQTPPLHNPYVAGESVVEIVDISLHARESAIEMLKFHIKRSQDRMKKYTDLKKKWTREVDVGSLGGSVNASGTGKDSPVSINDKDKVEKRSFTKEMKEHCWKMAKRRSG